MTHDRTYYRQCSERQLIEAARDSDSELAIALGERLDGWLYLQADIENLEDTIEDLKDEVARWQASAEEHQDTVEDLKDIIADLRADVVRLEGEVTALGGEC